MKVVIDPGHGGDKEVGGSSPNNAVGPTGLLEKKVTLDVGLSVLKRLQDLGIDCILTRSTDVNIGLADRAKIAKDTMADAFVSIHFNGFDRKTQGTETYAHSKSGQSSRTLAYAVQNGVLAATGLKDRGVKAAGFKAINPAHHYKDTAACLVEISFMDVADEEKRLKTSSYKDSIAAALARAIDGWLVATGKKPLADFEMSELQNDEGVEPEDGFDIHN